jgi:hypothetical protein
MFSFAFSAWGRNPLARPALSLAGVRRKDPNTPRQRPIRVRSMRECHPPESPVFRPLRLLHLCWPLPEHDMHIFDVMKCTYLYRQPPGSVGRSSSFILHPFHCGANVGHYPLPYFIPHPSSLIPHPSSSVHRPPSTICRHCDRLARSARIAPDGAYVAISNNHAS